MSDEIRESGIVTAISVVGFVFGIIGLLGSFIPCLGALAFYYVGIPAVIISGISLLISYQQKARKTFSIVALTISLLGVLISGFQYYKIMSAGKEAQREIYRMSIQGPNNSSSESESDKDSNYSYKVIKPKTSK